MAEKRPSGRVPDETVRRILAATKAIRRSSEDWLDGFRAGITAALNYVDEMPDLDKSVARTMKTDLVLHMVDAQHRRDATARETISKVIERLSPAAKAGATKRVRRELQDQSLAGEFAAHIRAGLTTDEAREKMNLGAVKAQRIRAIAVRMGFIRSRQRKAGTP
jgi:hypothetical protein